MSISETRFGGSATGLPAGLLPTPTPLPSMSSALSRRAALFGAVTATGILAAGVAPVLAAPIAVNPDAEMIEFAGRIEALARRDHALYDRRGDIEDRAHTLAGFRPTLLPEPEVPSGDRFSERKTATHRILTFTYPLAEDPAREQWKAATAAANAAYHDKCKAVEARLGLPELVKLTERSSNRLRRWSAQLADMHPQSAEGLSAKAAALVAIGDRLDDGFDEEGNRLALSLAHDAVRLGRGGVA